MHVHVRPTCEHSLKIPAKYTETLSAIRFRKGENMYENCTAVFWFFFEIIGKGYVGRNKHINNKTKSYSIL